jgi:hypothetical protein
MNASRHDVEGRIDGSWGARMPAQSRCSVSLPERWFSALWQDKRRSPTPRIDVLAKAFDVVECQTGAHRLHFNIKRSLY